MTTQSYWSGGTVVTGAARGQGAAEALRLLRAGAIVHALDVLPADDPTWDARAGGGRGRRASADTRGGRGQRSRLAGAGR